MFSVGFPVYGVEGLRLENVSARINVEGYFDWGVIATFTDKGVG